MRRKSRSVFSFSIQTTKPCGGAQPGRRLCVKDYRFKTLITTLLHFSTGQVILQYPPRKFRPAASAARAAQAAVVFGPSVRAQRPRAGRSGAFRARRPAHTPSAATRRRQDTPLSACKSLFHRALSFRVSRPAPRPGRSSRAAYCPHSAGSRNRSRTFPARRTARAAPP